MPWVNESPEKRIRSLTVTNRFSGQKLTVWNRFYEEGDVRRLIRDMRGPAR
jgi:hypothetical protein